MKNKSSLPTDTAEGESAKKQRPLLRGALYGFPEIKGTVLYGGTDQSALEVLNSSKGMIAIILIQYDTSAIWSIGFFKGPLNLTAFETKEEAKDAATIAQLNRKGKDVQFVTIDDAFIERYKAGFYTKHK